jgi:hypothetical protein
MGRAADIVAAIEAVDPQHRPLVEPRAPADRMVGNCREIADAVLDGTAADRRRLFELEGVRVPDVVLSARSQRADVIGPLG